LTVRSNQLSTFGVIRTLVIVAVTLVRIFRRLPPRDRRRPNSGRRGAARGGFGDEFKSSPVEGSSAETSVFMRLLG